MSTLRSLLEFLTEFLSRSNNFWKTRPLTLGHNFQNFKFSLLT